MKKIFAYIFFVVVFGQTYGQISSDDTLIFKLLCGEPAYKFSDKIYYADKWDNWKYLEEIISEKKEFEDRSGAKLKLTNDEQTILKKQIEKYKSFLWPDTLIANSKRFPYDSAWDYLSKQFSEKNEMINKARENNDTLTMQNLDDKHPFFYALSKPIFIRDNSIALSTVYACCGDLCGYNQTAFLRKVNGNWTIFIVLKSGVF